MASSTINSEQFQSLLQTRILPKIADTVFDYSPVLQVALKGAKPWEGRKLEKSVLIAEQGNGTFFAGLDTFNTNKADTKRKASFELRGLSVPVVVEGMERDAYASVAGREKATDDLLATALDEALLNLGEMAADAAVGDGTGTSNKAFNGLLSATDDGTVVDSYGGLSRTTYSTWAGNRYAPGAGLGDLDDFATAMTAASNGNDNVDYIFLTKALYDDFEGVLTPNLNFQYSVPQVRVTRSGISANDGSGNMAEAGFVGIKYRGATVLADSHVGTNYAYGINSKYFNFYGLDAADEDMVSIGKSMKNIESSWSDTMSNFGISYTGSMKPTSQYGTVGHLIMEGDIVTFNPGRHFQILFT